MMRTTEQFSITLPHDMAQAVQQKVTSGHYASASEVLREGVRALLAQDAALERWLREEALQSLAEHQANPSAAIDAGDVMGRVRARAATRRKDAKTA